MELLPERSRIRVKPTDTIRALSSQLAPDRSWGYCTICRNKQMDQLWAWNTTAWYSDGSGW